MDRITDLAAVSIVALAPMAAAQMGEQAFLKNPMQLTSRDDFTRAGEAYFDPWTSAIIFQATPVPPQGDEASPHYEMFIAPLEYDEFGELTGLGGAIALSTPASANTCGWFHPTQRGRILFATTFAPPVEDDQPGYQRGTGRYSWAFPREMQIVGAEWSPAAGLTDEPEPLFERDGYTAEGSWSPDGRHVLYAQIDPEKSRELGRPDADLYVFDHRTERHTALVKADGYDGGPFFSPDGRWITYRSDRRGDNLLQLFVAELAFGDRDDPGRVTGIKREIQITDNRHVNWAPFWHPSGRFLVYATSEVGHFNYEIFAIEVLDESGRVITDARPVRITHAEGFDGLPVFSNDGRYMMWTAQRGPKAPGEASRSSQLWIAEFDPSPILD